MKFLVPRFGGLNNEDQKDQTAFIVSTCDCSTANQSFSDRYFQRPADWSLRPSSSIKDIVNLVCSDLNSRKILVFTMK